MGGSSHHATAIDARVCVRVCVVCACMCAWACQAVNRSLVCLGMSGCQPPPCVACVLCVGHEHLEALGGSLDAVARAKAGIMKAGRPVVMAAQPHAGAARVLSEQAQQLGCLVLQAEQQVWVGGARPGC